MLEVRMLCAHRIYDYIQKKSVSFLHDRVTR